MHFTRKIPKNRLLVDFLPCKLRSDQRSAQPDNRGFFAASSAKIHKRNRLLEFLITTGLGTVVAPHHFQVLAEFRPADIGTYDLDGGGGGPA
jgi:hypothetical protein